MIVGVLVELATMLAVAGLAILYLLLYGFFFAIVVRPRVDASLPMKH